MSPIEYTDLASQVYDAIVSDIQSDKKIAYDVIAYLSMVSSLGPLNLPAHIRRWLDKHLAVLKDISEGKS